MMKADPSTGTILILGSGRQGLAAAYFLTRFAGIRKITFADLSQESARRAADHLRKMISTQTTAHVAPVNAFQINTLPIDARSREQLLAAFKNHAAVFSATSYELNGGVFEAAVEVGIPAVDLGGNTSIVFKQLQLHERALSKNITLVPDCGLAPGLANTLAAILHAEDSSIDEIFAYCGGLPQEPVGPLKYKIVFSIRGLTNEYLGEAAVLEKSLVTMKPTFTGFESLSFDKLGTLEAFRTSGGSSTAPWSFQKELKTYEYKTLRYPGHFKKIKTLIELGFLSDDSIDPLGDDEQRFPVSPRQMTESLLERLCAFPETRDLVVLRVSGRCSQQKLSESSYELIDYHDEATGLSAMERCTAFPAALVLTWALKGKLAAGIQPLERLIKSPSFIDDLVEAGLALTYSTSSERMGDLNA